MFDEMVKMAYDEIVGEEFDKEAGVKDAASKAWGGIKGAPGKAWSGIKGAAGAVGRTYSGRNVKDIKNPWLNSQDLADMIRSGQVKPGEGVKAMPEDLKKKLRTAQIQRGAAYAIPALALAGGTAYGIHRHNAKKRQAEQEQAEKAAAYYDEAQYAKEAALADYDEACAYEAAALEVLDDLGYLD